MRGVEALETAFARYLPQLVVAVVRGLPTLRAFNRGEEQAERIEQVSDRYRRAAMGTLRIAFPRRRCSRWRRRSAWRPSPIGS